MKYHRIDAKRLHTFMQYTFIAIGYSESDALRAADVLHYADLRGHDTHGVANLPGVYVSGVQSGEILPKATLKVCSRRGATAALEAGGALGLLAGQAGMQVAIDIAREFGIGCVTVADSSHFGAAGFYTEMAARQQMLGIAMTNLGRDPVAYPLGSRDPVMGTNPISVAVRGAAPQNGFSLDMSTTVIASGKVRQAVRRGKTVPEGWLHDARGGEVADPNRYFGDRSAFLPMLGGAKIEQGGHKGLGLGLTVEILCGVLAGAQTVADVGQPGRNSIGHCFIAIDPSFFGMRERFDAELDKLLNFISHAKVHPGFAPLQCPGAPDMATMSKRLRDGIPLDAALFEQLQDTAARLGIAGLESEGLC